MSHRAAAVFALLTLSAGAAAAQGYSGNWSIPGGQVPITLTLRQDRQGQITGSLSGQMAFQVYAQVQGEMFVGFASNAQGRLYIAGQIEGSNLNLIMAEVDGQGQPQMATARQLVASRTTGGRAGGTGVPGVGSAGGGGAGRGAGTGGGVVGSGPNDRQLAQLLLRSAWCSFSYVSGGGSSGRSSTERVVFRSDGTGSQATGGESYYSGANGSAYGNSSGGQPFQWRIQNGILMLSSDGATWGQTPLQVTQNSNGAPIINANGKEYSRCG